jgi:predicted nucleic acid-binding protein
VKVLLDTNVILDVLLNRSPWVAHAAPIWRAGYSGQFSLYLAATSLTNLFYIVRKNAGREAAIRSVETCLDALAVLPVDGASLGLAMSMKGLDFEDDVHIACAVRFGVSLIVTRDPAGFSASPVLALSPAEARGHLGV